MTDALRKLAALYGIETEYADARGTPRRPPDESLYAVLCALGAHVCYPPDVEDALRAKEAELARRRVPRVVGAFGGSLSVPIRFIEGERRSYAILLRAEDGTESRFAGVADERFLVRREEIDGVRAAVYRVPVASRLAPGYLEVDVEVGGASHKVRAISAPRRTWCPEDEGGPRKCWGVFAPVQGLRSPDSLGTGDLHDLALLLSEVYRRGGRVVGTPPLLATFPRDRLDVGPCAPLSRFFWNELYLDVRALAEQEADPGVRAALASVELGEIVHALDQSRYVDPARAMALKRPLLERLAERFFARDGADAVLEEAFAREPLLDAYARFRATLETRGEPFRAWPARSHGGALDERDYAPQSYRYHVYVQLRLREQLDALQAKAREGDGLGLYLDLPPGVHPDGFDVFRFRGLFAEDVKAGAPPDDFFRRGQLWGFPPLLPEALRADGYAYVRRSLANHMRHAGVLQVDRVAALHRLFFVPRGMEPKDGVYVRYPTEELYAVLAVESHRHRTLVVGEDLGAVAPEVRETMAVHGIDRMHVVSRELESLFASGSALRRALPHDVVASVNANDLATFTAFVDGRDIDTNLALGHLEGHEARDMKERRRAALDGLWRAARPHEGAPLDAGVLLRHLLEELGSSDARVVIATLEDLWLEELPPATPEAATEQPELRRRIAHALPELFARADVTSALGDLDFARRTA